MGGKSLFLREISLNDIDCKLDNLIKDVNNFQNRNLNFLNYLKETIKTNEKEGNISQRLRDILKIEKNLAIDARWISKVLEGVRNGIQEELKPVTKTIQTIFIRMVLDVKSVVVLLTKDFNSFKISIQDQEFLTSEQSKEIHRIKDSFVILREISENLATIEMVLPQNPSLPIEDLPCIQKNIRSIDETICKIDDFVKKHSYLFDNPSIVRVSKLDDKNEPNAAGQVFPSDLHWFRNK